MKKIVQIVVLMLLANVTFAQKGNNKKNHDGKNHSLMKPEGFEKLKALKIGFITEKLKLSSEQATNFWPVYNEFDAKRMELRLEARDKIQAAPDDASKRLDEIEALRKKEFILESDYSARFRKVLTPQQALDLYKVEIEFREMLLRERQERRKKQ
jgi:Spy/CpxP family protein refolding chaperone